MTCLADVAEFLRRVRLEAGLSQEELAKQT